MIGPRVIMIRARVALAAVPYCLGYERAALLMVWLGPFRCGTQRLGDDAMPSAPYGSGGTVGLRG